MLILANRKKWSYTLKVSIDHNVHMVNLLDYNTCNLYFLKKYDQIGKLVILV
ncbi:hypothetical protein [Neobacillus mesonae]|uniref:hypothetical protein n=1 Tax=Neobacillus mesonae TaxID=1193713 RepID=UPI002042642D|nr:hypothetical protein [Neobacillus mesonae]MCM3567819.1 hypothetical protein [Neobacillus mesonae]